MLWDAGGKVTCAHHDLVPISRRPTRASESQMPMLAVQLMLLASSASALLASTAVPRPMRAVRCAPARWPTAATTMHRCRTLMEAPEEPAEPQAAEPEAPVEAGLESPPPEEPAVLTLLDKGSNLFIALFGVWIFL